MSETEEKRPKNTLKFSFYLTENNWISIPAYPNWTFEKAIKKAGGKLKRYSLKDNILIAQLNGPVGKEAAILPDILCSKLLPYGKIRSKPKKNAIPASRTVDGEDGTNENDETEQNDPKPQTLFFVKSTNPRTTKISSGCYAGKDLGVIVYDGDTIKNALLNDGRFSDVEDLELRVDDDRNEVVGLDYQASNYSEYVFNAKKPTGRKRKRDKPTPNGECTTESVDASEKAVYTNMPKTLTQPFSEEFGRGMIQDARRSALNMFAEAGVEEDTDNYIRKVARKFGKLTSLEIPARIMEPIGKATNSVGFIQCGDVSGTCFLVDSKYIITCFHIINDIFSLRSQSTDPERFKDIIVRFSYIYSQNKGPTYAVVDEGLMRLFCIYDSRLDYVILPLKLSPEVSHLPSLGHLVRTVLPRSGRVIVVGHPDSKRKSAETCSILPGYQWHAILCARAEEAEHQCEQNPEECHLHNPVQECVHVYRNKKPELEHTDQLPYDTSFFEGASGSPVFNTDGHIVAMHTQGYPFFNGHKRVSLMEFGVTFSAIFRDIKDRYGDQHARKLFPDVEM